MAERKKTLELKKHVATIHSSSKLGLLQRKIANALLFNAYDELLEKDEHEIHVATLCKLIGYDSNDHKSVKKALVNLLATVIEWNLVDGSKLDSQGIWNASSIIADAGIDGPICTYSYSNKMKDLLYRPEVYGRLNMLVQAQFQSSYGLALYENCIRYQGIEQTPWFDLAKFRKLMGVDDGKYKIFRDFKTRVLDIAVKEVNKYSSITITPQFQRQKRQVIAIQFLIKNSTQVIDEPESETHLTLSDTLKFTFGLSRKQLEETLSHYDERYIRDKINLIESSSSFISGKITNLAKYLICALQDDYQPARNSKKVQKVTHQFESRPVKKVGQTRIEEYRRYQNREIIKIFEQKSEQEKKNILSTFEKELGKGIYRDIYLRDGLSNILIQDQLCLYIRQKMSKLINTIQSYEEFLGVDA